MENNEIPREELADLARKDLLDATPVLEAISSLCSMVVLDQDDEFRVAMLLALVQFQTIGLLTLLGMIDTEVDILNATRERDRQENHELDSDDSASRS